MRLLELRGVERARRLLNFLLGAHCKVLLVLGNWSGTAAGKVGHLLVGFLAASLIGDRWFLVFLVLANCIDFFGLHPAPIC